MKKPESFSVYRSRKNAEWKSRRPPVPEGPPPTLVDYALFAWIIVTILSLAGTLFGVHEIAIVIFGLCAVTGVIALALALLGIVRW